MGRRDSKFGSRRLLLGQRGRLLREGAAEEIGLEHAFGIEPFLQGQIGVDPLLPKSPDDLIRPQH